MATVVENGFVVSAPPEATYSFMVDPERVAPCLPGAEILDKQDDGSIRARMPVKLGPMRLLYEGTVKITEILEDERRAVMLAEGREKRGQGAAKATMTLSVADGDPGSRVTITSEIEISGRVAQMGSHYIPDVASAMVDEMGRAIEAALNTSDTTPKPTPPT
jgi:uncharacterized protein